MTEISPAQGATLSLEQLIALQKISTGFELTAQRKILSSMSGGHQSSFRGRGMDFDEVRAYQPGDEVKSIDWRVTARTNEVHTKVFKEEKERPIFIIADQSSSLAFGSQTAFKSVTVAYTAALLAWASYRSGDRVGGIIFSDHCHKEIKPKEGKKSILRYLQILAEYNQQLVKNNIQHTNDNAARAFTLDDALASLHRVIRPGSLIFILSDFIGFNQQTINNIRLLNRHNDLISFHVSDPLERTAPRKGAYPVSDGSHYGTWKVQSASQRQAYQGLFLRHHQDIKATLLKQGIPLIDISTEDNPVTILNQALAMRRSKRGKLSA